MFARFKQIMQVVAVICLSVTCFSPVSADTPCLEAVFFDLGNTLVENSGGTYVLREGADQTITDLQALNIRLGVITNVPPGWDLDDLRALLAEPDFLNEFEVVILSSQAPAAKPDPAIYTFAHAALPEPGVPIAATAFVGETLGAIADREVDPTEGARSVGMIGIHLSDLTPSPLTDFTIPADSLNHVVSIVVNSCASSGADETPTGDRTRLLHLPHPNPSQDRTRIEFSIPTEERVDIRVFDAQGRRVADLIDHIVPAGQHEISWDGRGYDGRLVPGGIYYSRMRAGREFLQVKMLRLQ